MLLIPILILSMYKHIMVEGYYLDLLLAEDFYKRLGRDTGPAIEPEPEIDNTDDNVLVAEPVEQKPKSERDLMKEKLDAMGIEYKGNASNQALRELLDEVTDAAVQDEG